MEQKFRNIYEELFNSMKLIESKNTKKEGFVAFTAMQGHKYRNCADIQGKEFRLMLVGRAVNDWDEYRPSIDMSSDEFVESSICNLMNLSHSIVHGKDRFEWIDTEGDSANNCVREGIDRDAEAIRNKPYSLRKSPLWAYTKQIWENIYGEEQKWEKRWFENIVWSNLYKIAPRGGGNPNGKEVEYQQNVSVKLLKQEIEFFNPTHILFLTGFDWFKPFENLFNNVKPLGRNCVSGENKNDIYIEGIATYRTKNNTNISVVIACRPEMREKKGFTDKISKTLKEMIAE